jgi:transcriptional regulator with XRE-family HTH domain
MDGRMNTLGRRIRFLREHYVFSQTELAREAGITQPALCQIENEGRTPRPATIRKIASALSRLSGETIQPHELRAEQGKF